MAVKYGYGTLDINWALNNVKSADMPTFRLFINSIAILFAFLSLIASLLYFTLLHRADSANVETIVTLFDHTEKYNQADRTIGFVALAVHELRTPLTLLRGYIEVFEDELADKLDPELQGFLQKMQASAQLLSAFVNNILNFSRVESDQLTLDLDETSWNDIVTKVVNDLKVRAFVKNKQIELQLAPNLPAVAADSPTAE